MQNIRHPQDESTAIERHYRYEKAAERLGVSPSMVRKLVVAHEIRFVRIGTAVAIPESALREYLERNAVSARERSAK